jgi:hypothetical protein
MTHEHSMIGDNDMKADRALEWEKLSNPNGVWSAKRGRRSEYRIYGSGPFMVDLVDGGFSFQELHRSLETLEDAKRFCQDRHNRQLRREAWDAYMISHDPPEGTLR